MCCLYKKEHRRKPIIHVWISIFSCMYCQWDAFTFPIILLIGQTRRGLDHININEVQSWYDANSENKSIRLNQAAEHFWNLISHSTFIMRNDMLMVFSFSMIHNDGAFQRENPTVGKYCWCCRTCLMSPCLVNGRTTSVAPQETQTSGCTTCLPNITTPCA